MSTPVEIQLFTDVMRRPTPETQLQFVFEHPVLLKPETRERIQRTIDAGETTGSAKAEAVLRVIADLADRLDRDEVPYPFGWGPIEAVWKREIAGEIGEDQAIALVQNANVTSLLAPVYVHSLCRKLELLAMENWTHAVWLHRLIRAAVESLPDAENAEMRHDVSLGWLGVVTRAVSDVPDGRLFRDAVSVGEQLLVDARTNGDVTLEGNTLHRLGVLYLDPYRAGRSSADYGLQLERWRERLHQHYGDLIAGVSKEELAMPSPSEALDRATEYLRAAAALRSGVRRAQSLKALGEALEWREVLDQPVDRDAVVDALREALSLFDPRTAPVECAAVMAVLARHGESIPDDTVEALLSTPVHEAVRRLGEMQGFELAHQVIGLASEQRPEGALAMATELESLLSETGRDHMRGSVWRQQLGLIRRTYAPDAFDGDESEGSLPLAAERLRQRAARESWDEQKLGAALLAYAGLSPRGDQESVGLELLDEAAARAPMLAERFEGAFSYLRANLSMGTAVNILNAGQPADAILLYAEALRMYLRLRLRTDSMDLLRRMHDLRTRDDPEVINTLAASLADVAVDCEVLLGEPATRVIQDACRVLMQRVAATGTVNPTLVLLLFNIAKGLRFAAALHASERYVWDEDPEGLKLLDEAQRAAAAIEPAMLSTPNESPLNDAMILAAYVGVGGRSAGQTAQERLDNLRQSYDEHVGREMLRRVRGELTLFPTPEQVQAELDERTVLLNYYLGTAPNGGLAIYSFVITKDDFWMTYGYSNDLPSGYAKASYGGREIVVTLEGMSVQALLAEIVETPWSGVVNAEAADSLVSGANNYLGSLREYLAKQRAAGRDHLCIVPHGPLHFYPMHLVGPADHPLADDWIVTYLPNLRLLTRRHGAMLVTDEVPASDVAAIGLTFSDSPPGGPPPLPQAEVETRRIAELFGVQPLLDADATEPAVMDALQNASFVHLSTHGEHCLAAPAFQKVFVASDSSSDGVICAYELLGLDLHHVECLTLSACETALGRFDAGDNLRGLPASFFLSGARTVIGTLWPIDTDASASFFTSFYEELRQGAGRLDAFSTAQRTTRQQFPEYRDWGAFYLAGDWREEVTYGARGDSRRRR